MKCAALLTAVASLTGCALFAQTNSQLNAPNASPAHSRRSSLIAPSMNWAELKAQGAMRRYASTPAASVITRNSAGQVTKVLEPDAQGNAVLETDITYNPQGKVIKIVQHGSAGDALRIRSFSYDAQSRVTSATSPEAGTISYTYDANGNIATKTDARGVTITYTWDAKRRLISKTYSDGAPAVHIVYDDSSASVTSYRGAADAPVGKRVDHYNGQGLLASLTVDTPSSGHATIALQYDSTGRLTGITYPDGTAFTQTWDSANRLDSISSADTRYFSTPLYSATQALTAYTLGDAIAVQRSFDATHHLAELSAFSHGQQLLDKVYAYTATGDVEQFADNLNRAASFSYAYDSLDRITRAEQPDGDLKRSFDYDAFGDRASSAQPKDRQHFDASNRFSSSTGFTYDAAGEMTFDGRHHYTFNADGYIVSVDDGAVTYVYDAEGNRIAKRTKTKDGKEDVTSYIWLDGQLLAQRQPDGRWIDYVYANGNRIASTATHIDPKTGNPVADATTYFLTDKVGLTRVAFDADGDVLSEGDFAPFGTELRDRTRRSAPGIGSAANISFTGEVHDDETGLDTYRFRSYSPELGRWMSPDPSSLHFSNLAVPQTFNLYDYVTNDPLKYIDIDGLDECGCDYVPFDTVDAGLLDGSGGDEIDMGGGGGGGGAPCDYDTCVTVSSGPESPIDPLPSDPIVFDPTIPSTPPPNPPTPVYVNVTTLITQARQQLSATCASKFAQVIGGYTTSAFFNSLSTATFEQYLYSSSIPPTLSYPYGADAFTVAQMHTIYLLPNFFTLPASTQPFVILHEGLHLATGASDASFQQAFGLPISGDTDNITRYIQGGCIP